MSHHVSKKYKMPHPHFLLNFIYILIITLEICTAKSGLDTAPSLLSSRKVDNLRVKWCSLRVFIARIKHELAQRNSIWAIFYFRRKKEYFYKL